MSLLTAGGLFCGIGGFCLSFSNAGVKNIWSIDNDEASEKTYRHNLLDSNFINNDIKSVKAQNLEPVDILHAGFPCQSFSQAGERRGFDDPRGQLFFDIIRIIKEFKDRKPKVLVLENSPHIKYGEGGSWFLQLQAAIRGAGYWFRDTNAAELNAFDLTPLPQQRTRLFMVAFSTDYFKSGRFEFPSEISTVEKDLTKYIDFGGVVDDDYYLSPENRYHQMISSQMVKTRVQTIYQLRKYVVRAKAPGVCPTLTANMGSGGHNVPFIVDRKGLRKLTEHECLRLQGFPDSFAFPDETPRHRRYSQVGNAVPVPLGTLVAERVVKKISEVLL